MSLLEDVFLADEAGEAQELERIIEGDDEYDERVRPSTPNSDDNSEKEDEAEEDKRHVDPASTKQRRVVKNPRVILNPARLTGPRGIQIIPEHFKDFKFKGKGHEKEDLDLVLKKLEHWAYRLFPKFQFADCLKKIETLGNKRPVMVHLTKIRTDQFMSDETVVQRESSDEEGPAPVQEEDEFDKLLQQQIELARSTPAPGSVGKPVHSTPMVDKSLTMPKASASPSINDEQRERMIRNRQLAEERRLARLKQKTSQNNISAQENATNVPKEPDTDDNCIDTVNDTMETNTVPENTDIFTMNEYENRHTVKNNRSHVIESSDDDDALVINESVTVDVHSRRNYDSDDEKSNDDSRKRIDAKDGETIIISEDVEMNDIRGNNSNTYEIGDQSNEPENTDTLQVFTGIPTIKNNEEIVTKKNYRCNMDTHILNSDIGKEKAEVIDNGMAVNKIDSEAEINHEVKENQNPNQHIKEADDGYKKNNKEKVDRREENTDSNEGKSVSHKDNAESPKLTPDKHGHEGSTDSPEGNVDNYKGNADNHEGKADSHEGKAESHEGKADNHEGKADNVLEDIMDVDFSDDF